MNTESLDYISDPIARAQVMRSQAIAAALITAFSPLAKAVRVLAAEVARYASYRRVYLTLSEMTDRELDDVGLCRADIETVARGHDPRPAREAYLASVIAQHTKLEQAYAALTVKRDPAGANDNQSVVAA